MTSRPSARTSAASVVTRAVVNPKAAGWVRNLRPVNAATTSPSAST